MATMDPTIKALSFIKRVTGKTVAEVPAAHDKLMLLDLWEREIAAVRQKLVLEGTQATLASAEAREFGHAGKL
jgi:hypothetical protein